MTLSIAEMGSPKPKAERIPEGTYMGRIQSIVDLGTQPQTDWQTGEKTESKKKVLITWELPTERITITVDEEEVDKPRWISKEYTLSNFDQSALMKLLGAIAPQGINRLSELVDTACMVSVGSTSTGNAKITGVVSVPAGMEVQPLENEATYFDFDAPEQELFELQVNWVKEKIKGADNYNGFADEWE